MAAASTVKIALLSASRGGGVACGDHSSELPVGVGGCHSARAAVHGDARALSQRLGPNARVHDRGDAVFAGDDRGVRARPS